MGRVVLLGDACHPMLPYVAQGAAQAVEDVAVLHLAIDRISSKEDLPLLLKAYELARKPRAEHIMSVAGVNRHTLHYPDGPEQQERDRKFRAVLQGGDNPDLLGDAKAQQYLWDHDPEKEFLNQVDGMYILVDSCWPCADLHLLLALIEQARKQTIEPQPGTLIPES